MIVQSGNDACIVLAEGIAGSEEAFADLMNKTAKEIGLQNSHFTNATGWPDPNHRMTARDLAILASRIMKDFPEYMHYDQQKEFTYHNIKQGNRNPLLYGYPGGDGLKTGHTDEGGYGLVGTAMRDGRRLIVVFNGTASMQERADEARFLLDYGFREFRNVKLYKAGDVIAEPKIWMGTAPKVPMVIKQDILFTLPVNAARNIDATVQYESPLQAPIAKDQQIGTLNIKINDTAPKQIPLYAAESVDRLGFFGRFKRGMDYMLFGETM
jgi:D-alanyl-D-alanine carboxypeptidase (penicillin-binding protein 5/6)